MRFKRDGAVRRGGVVRCEEEKRDKICDVQKMSWQLVTNKEVKRST
jgi:hypothetical protein